MVWSTYLGCFSASAAFYLGSVHFLYFYPVMLLNLVLLALVRSLWFPPGLLLLLGFTVLSGLAGMLQGTDTIALYLKSEVGIVLSSVYACAFLRYMRFDAAECFRRYAWMAFYVATLGFAIYAGNLALGHLEYRMRSVEYEPGEFCIVTLPAVYYFADQWQRHRRYGRQCLLMLAAIGFSRSSIGFMGLFVGMYLFGTRFRFGALFAPLVIAGVGLGIYAVSPDFQLRLDDSVTAFTLLDASSINDSTFSLLSGGFVAARAFAAHPLLGEGLGSISMVNSRYINGLPGVDAVREELLSIASGDGGSMLFRLAGETGLVGLGLAFGFLLYCYPRKESVEQKQTALALLVYVFLKLLRSGVYFNPEVLLLLTMYAVNGAPLLRQSAERLRAELLRAELAATALPGGQSA